MHTVCTQKGKHRCEDFEDMDNVCKSSTFKRLCQIGKKESCPSTSRPHLRVDVDKANSYDTDFAKLLFGQILNHKNDLREDKGKLLLDAIERTGLKKSTKVTCEKQIHGRCIDKYTCVQNNCARKDESSDKSICDMSESDNFSSIKYKNAKSKYDVYVDHCDSPIPKYRQIKPHKKIQDVTNIDFAIIKRKMVKKKLIFDQKDGDDNEPEQDPKVSDKDHNSEIPTALEQEKFRKDLDHAASMVFHSRTGLPLTSSPAPVRRGKSCFDFDSSINSVSAIKR